MTFAPAPPSLGATARLSVDLDAIAANYRFLRDISPKAQCGAVVKADGYGLGAVPITKRLLREGCRHFFVFSWLEATELKAQVPDANIRVFSGFQDSDVFVAQKLDAIPILTSLSQLERWKTIFPERPYDIMVDTGMNRLGLRLDEIGQLEPAGAEIIHTQFACAALPDHPLNAVQLDRFAEVVARGKAKAASLCNSAGIALGSQAHHDLTRPGIALYGGVPTTAFEGQLQHCVGLEAQILCIRDVEVGESVGYDAAWSAERPSKIAIIGLGYGDGYLRILGEGGYAYLDGAACRVVGHISMDVTAVDVTDSNGVEEGDWLAVEGEKFDLATLAARSQLNKYEVLTTLGRRFERRYIGAA